MKVIRTQFTKSGKIIKEEIPIVPYWKIQWWNLCEEIGAIWDSIWDSIRRRKQ